MKRTLSLLAALLFVSSLVFSADDLWSGRNTADGAKKAYDACKADYESKKDYDSAWKYARIAAFYCDNFVKDPATRKVLYTAGKNAAEAATKLSPGSVEGWYYLGLCLGKWGEVNGIMESLGAVGPIINAATKAIAINPGFQDGAPYVLRGRVYQKAPGVISAGDPAKAEADYRKTIASWPKNRTVYRFLAELKRDQGKKDEAKTLVATALAIPYDSSDSVAENSEISVLKKLQADLNK